VVVISEAFALDGPDAAEVIGDGFDLVDRRDLVHRGTEDQLVSALDGAWAVVAGSERYTAGVLGRSHSLRVVARPGVGVDAVDVVAASRQGIAVVVTPGANDESVADLALALMLAGARRLVELDARTRSGSWRPPWLGRELYRATVGIVGLGAIGQAVARRLRGFECRIMATEPRPDRAACEQLGIELAELHEMLPQVDIVTLHVPLMPATRGLIGERELGLLQPHALIVNTARGGIIDEAALVAALRDGRIGGAALDVFEHEPLEGGDVLANLSSVTLSPHHAAFTRQAVARMARMTADSLIELAAGRIPSTCVNALHVTRSSGLEEGPA
jgi:phosphoglycerate dehydrogenase-like enzyme